MGKCINSLQIPRPSPFLLLFSHNLRNPLISLNIGTFTSVFMFSAETVISMAIYTHICVYIYACIFIYMNVYAPAYMVRHIKCYRAIALKLLIITKNVSGKSFSVREGRHIGPLYFLSVEALKQHQGQLHFFRWKYVFFFDDTITDFKTNLVTYSTGSF